MGDTEGIGPPGPQRTSRAVHRAGLALVMAALFWPALALSEQARALDGPRQKAQLQRRAERTAPGDVPKAAVPGRLIAFADAHVHLNDPAMQLELMDRWGASHAVVFWGRRSNNESVAEFAMLHADRLIPFASISPERDAYRNAWTEDDPALLAQLDALLATGRYKGIGEISATHFASAGFAQTDFSPTGKTMTGVMTLARQYRLPVMVHVESTRMAELERMLDGFADVPVIWAHGGYTPLDQVQGLLARHPNLFYELSARTWPRHPRSADYSVLTDGANVAPEWLALIEAQPHRFLVGTDASHHSPDAEAMKFASVQNFLGQLSAQAQERVGRANLLGLLGMPPGARVPP